MAGPAPETLIDAVQPDDLRQAVRATLDEWWSPPFPQPERFGRADYQAYAALTMCRALYTLQHGTVVSKPHAARGAQQALEEHWSGLIEWALVWPGEGLADHPGETLDFVLFTLGRSRSP